jgi:TetR/AcrR family transcriptional repressor of lmrAB and yxaGH operons
MPRRTDSRARMVEAAFDLFRKRGYHATAFSDVVQESGAPRGSIYFHFPGGKQELAREVIALAGDEIEKMVEAAAGRAHDPGSLVRALGDIVAKRLEDSGYQSGCSIATMVLELAPQDEELSAEFDAVFARWRAALVDQFEQMGVAPERAAVLAELVMSAIEGALVLSRAARSPEPFRSTVDALSAIVDREAASPLAVERFRRRPARRPRGVERVPRSR